jgi:hypothetical protein
LRTVSATVIAHSFSPFGEAAARTGNEHRTGALFIPKYEIAVYEGAAPVVFSKAPEMVFYYPDKAAALLRLGDLESAIVEGGLDGAPTLDFIRDANHALAGPK